MFQHHFNDTPVPPNDITVRPPMHRSAIMVEIELTKKLIHVLAVDTLHNVEHKMQKIMGLYQSVSSLDQTHLVLIDLEGLITDSIDQYFLYEYIISHQHSPLTFALAHAIWRCNVAEAKSIVNAMLTIEKPSMDD